jgi:hypothetical protein
VLRRVGRARKRAQSREVKSVRMRHKLQTGPCPTFPVIAHGPGKARIQKSRKSRERRRATLEPPSIFVAKNCGGPGQLYARAHLRNKRGYVYLTWRDGDRVRAYYLGKTPRKSPTRALELAGAGEACRTSTEELLRRGKKPPR